MRLKSRQADSNQTDPHRRLFAEPMFNEVDALTSWQKFERLASAVINTPRNKIDNPKPVRPRKAKRA